MRTLDEMTQHNAALVEETNAAIEQTEARGQQLDRIVDIFTLAEAGGIDGAAGGLNGSEDSEKGAAHRLFHSRSGANKCENPSELPRKCGCCFCGR